MMSNSEARKRGQSEPSNPPTREDSWTDGALHVMERVHRIAKSSAIITKAEGGSDFHWLRLINALETDMERLRGL